MITMRENTHIAEQDERIAEQDERISTQAEEISALISAMIIQYHLVIRMPHRQTLS